MEISLNPSPAHRTFLNDSTYEIEALSGMPSEEEVVVLQRILRGELSAIAAYEHVIHQFGNVRYRAAELLGSILVDHEEAVFDLERILRDEGVEPDEDSGAWGKIVQAVVASAGLFGEGGALRALRTGEEFGLRRYQEALGEGEVSYSRDYIRYRSIPTQQLHIDRVSAFLNLRSVSK